MGMVLSASKIWEQFIFVNFDSQSANRSPPFSEKFPSKPADFEFSGLQFAERRDYIINCNWKVYVDNYLEGYHIPIAHPG